MARTAVKAAGVLGALSGAAGLDLTFDTTTAAYSLGVDGKTWLQGDVYAVKSQGHLYVSGNDLSLTSCTPTQGNGKFGAYTGYSCSWTAGGANILVTNFYQYAKLANSWDASAIVFEQFFPVGVQGTASQNGYDLATCVLSRITTATVAFPVHFKARC